MPTVSPFMTSREAAAHVRMSYSWFLTLQSKGLTPAIGAGRRGARVLYTAEALERWMQTRWTKKRGRPSAAKQQPVEQSAEVA